MDIKRVYVHETIYDDFLATMVAVGQTMKSGDSTNPEAVLGPIQNSMQYAKLQTLYHDIGKQGLKTALGGGLTPSDAPNDTGYWVTPTILDNPPEDSHLVNDEHFGPIVPVLKWSDEEDVIRRANTSQFGLGGSVWTADIARGERIARQLEAGSVWVNAHFSVGPQVSFGGFKNSGISVESGMEGLKGWCNPQAVWVKK